MNEIDQEVLWLRRPEERQSPPARAVLWPAAEYAALIFGHIIQADVQIDPFERAVLGASSNGLIEIKKQAEFLGLNEGFVGHLQERLRGRGLLDDRGRPLGKSEQLLLPQYHTAVRLYQDLWTGLLWPRFAIDQWRRTLPLESRDGGITLVAGSTGRPEEIRAFLVHHHSEIPTPPTADDAHFAVRSWTRFRSRLGVGDFEIPQGGPIKLLPDSRQFVYLCCPNHLGRPGRPRVDDPFGGPTWAPFTRALVERSRAGQPLGRWLYGSQPDDKATSMEVGDGLPDRIGVLVEHVENARQGDWGQLRLDIEHVGHEAVDTLWAGGTEDLQITLLDPQSDHELLTRLCASVGFDPAGPLVVPDLPNMDGGASGTLIERCAGLLLRYRVDRASPLHRLAARCPDLFLLLSSAAGAGGAEALKRMMTAVVALGESAADLDMTASESDVGNA